MYFDEQLKIKIVMITSYIYIYILSNIRLYLLLFFLIDSIDLEDSEYF